MSLANRITRASTPLVAGMMAISASTIALSPLALSPRELSAPRVALAAGILPGLPTLPDLGIGSAAYSAVSGLNFFTRLGGAVVYTELAMLGVPIPIAAQPFVLTNYLVSPVSNSIAANLGGVVDGIVTLPQALAQIGGDTGAAIATTTAWEQFFTGAAPAPAPAVQQLSVKAPTTPQVNADTATIQPAALPGLPDLGAGIASAVGGVTFTATLVTQIAGAVLTNQLGVPTPLAIQPYVVQSDLVEPVINAAANGVGAVIDGRGTIPQALTGIVSSVGAAVGTTLQTEQAVLGTLSPSIPAVQQLRTNVVTPAAISHTPTVLSDAKTTTDSTQGDQSGTGTDNHRPRHAKPSGTGTDNHGPRHAKRSSDGKHTNHTSGSGGSSSGRHARS
jgi:hypothetical protein